MTLGQLQNLKRWHVGHAARAPVELFFCDVVLACWTGAWVILPLTLMLNAEEYLPASLLLSLMPDFYSAARALLHRHGVLRCDWLSAVKDH